MDNKKIEKKKNSNEDNLLIFLKKTKEGTYAKIDENSFDYIRIREETETIDPTNESYYYSIS